MSQFSNLADAANYLGNLSEVMQTYDAYDNAAQGWFYAFNPALSGAARRPAHFGNWDHWRQFSSNQRAHLCRQAKLDSSKIGETSAQLRALREEWKNGTLPTAW